MTENERMSAIKRVKAQLKEGYVDLGAHDEDEIEVIRQAMAALGAIGQYKWERDVAFEQLKELGTQFGLKTDGMKAVNFDELAESVEDKMIRATRKANVTKQDLLDVFAEKGLIAVYNLGLKNMLDYLNGN